MEHSNVCLAATKL